jgi:regulator of replication initiation timing
MSQGQVLKKRTQDLESQVAAACSERDSMKQQLEEARTQSAASLSLHISQLKAKNSDLQRMEEATEQLRATYVKRFKKLEDALQQVWARTLQLCCAFMLHVPQAQDEVKKANKEKERAQMKVCVRIFQSFSGYVRRIHAARLFDTLQMSVMVEALAAHTSGNRRPLRPKVQQAFTFHPSLDFLFAHTFSFYSRHTEVRRETQTVESM